MGTVKSSFFRLFVGGFAVGVVGMVALQPVEATRALGQQFHLAAAR